MKKTVKTSEAVSLYNILKGLKIAKLPKEEQFKILHSARAFKAPATAFEDYLSDVKERLKPENFNELAAKAQRFNSLSDEEKAEINTVLEKYQKDIEDCVAKELEREVEVEGVESLSQDGISALTEQNDLDVEKLILLEDM